MTKPQPRQTTPMRDTPIAAFEDPRNITRGKGRIVYAPAAVDCSGKTRGAGWVLPGGERTTNESHARDAADWINDFASAGLLR